MGGAAPCRQLQTMGANLRSYGAPALQRGRFDEFCEEREEVSSTFEMAHEKISAETAFLMTDSLESSDYDDTCMLPSEYLNSLICLLSDFFCLNFF